MTFVLRVLSILYKFAWWGRNCSTFQQSVFMTLKLQGAFTALVTPFTDDGGAVDYIKLRELVEWQIQEGINGLVPMGTTGECPTVTHDEHDRVIAEVVAAADGRVPVIAGTGSNNTAEALRLTRAAKEHGADACLVVCPYYNKPTQKGLYAHFKAVADVGLPVVVYNIPGRTNVNLTPQTIAELYKLPNIVAIEESTGSLDQAMEIAALCDIIILSGDDNLTLPLMAMGATGVISVLSNASPRKVLAVTDPMLKGDYATARKAALENTFLVKALFSEANPQPIKKLLQLMGKCSSAVRAPLVECEPSTVEHLSKLAKENKFM